MHAQLSMNLNIADMFCTNKCLSMRAKFRIKWICRNL